VFNNDARMWLDILTIIIIIIQTFIMRKLIQNRECARLQSKAEQISFQFTAKSDQGICQSQFSWKAVPWTAKDREP